MPSSEIPGLDAISRDPRLLEGLDAVTLAALALRANAVVGSIAAQFALASTNGVSANGAHVGGPLPDADRLLDIDEAAAKTRLSKDQLYRRKDLPFRVKVAARQVRFSERGIERWIRARIAKLTV